VADLCEANRAPGAFVSRTESAICSTSSFWRSRSPVTFGNLHGSGPIAECAQQRSGNGSPARAPARDGAPQARC
jgi:hypothetical protein